MDNDSIVVGKDGCVVVGIAVVCVDAARVDAVVDENSFLLVEYSSDDEAWPSIGD